MSSNEPQSSLFFSLGNENWVGGCSCLHVEVYVILFSCFLICWRRLLHLNGRFQLIVETVFENLSITHVHSILG